MSAKSMNACRRLVIALVSAGAVFTLSGCGGGDGESSGTPPVPPAVLTVTHTVRITTNLGVIELGLDRNHAPVTVDNFLKYVNDGFYTSTVFHRVVRDFVIQGGGFTRVGGGLVEKTPTYRPIKLESNNGLSNLRGTIAMARTGDPDSAASQFFINTVDNTSLNYPGADGVGGYAVFGKVTAGLDVVDTIRAVEVTNQVPNMDITITEAKVVP
jgi:cyclophilin family peptidyl-prolyl cis-trans isomerase